MSSVYQTWFHAMPWKMQSIASNGLRAPDTASKAVKKAVRWMRTQMCSNADPNKADCYMTVTEVPSVEDVSKELEYMTCHYVHHFADAMRVISIYHPERDTRTIAWNYHHDVAEEIFHFVPETNEDFIYRHRDKVEHA